MEPKTSFVRNLHETQIAKLLESSLFQKELIPDIKSGAVFPAIRGWYIDFYHKGGKLFTYNKDFKTHKKYASVIKSPNDDISESDLKQKVKLISDFSEDYPSIKQNCSLYSGDEAKGVSRVYHKYSYTKKDSDVVVLDIEVSFKANEDYGTQDRIDILLFNKKTQKLRFYEAKHFSNKEIWAKENTQPEVVSQIQRYEKQIEQKKDTILKQYGNYVKIVNELFGCELPKPIDIDKEITLLVFGFDRDQQQGRMKNLLLKDGSLTGIQYYFVGDISSVKIDNMWKTVKCG
jgi:hypothetical protein